MWVRGDNLIKNCAERLPTVMCHGGVWVFQTTSYQSGCLTKGQTLSVDAER